LIYKITIIVVIATIIDSIL